MNAPIATLGRAIRQRRIEIGLTQEELAGRMGEGVRQSDVSRLERDRIQLPRAARLRALAAALEMEPGELLLLSGWQGAFTAPKPRDISEESVRDGSDEQAAVTVGWATFRLSEVLRQSRAVQARFTEVIAQSDRAAEAWRLRFGLPSERD